MVVIRMSPAGKKGEPLYRVVVCNSGAKLTGRYIERIGIFSQFNNVDKMSLKKSRFEHWVKLGAQPTTRVVNLMKKLSSQIVDLEQVKTLPEVVAEKAAAAPARARPAAPKAKARSVKR